MNYLKFQFAILLLIGLCLVSACNEDSDDDNNVPSTNETTIWSGTKITFEKQCERRNISAASPPL